MDKLQGFCDLNIPLKCGPSTTLKELVRKAVEFGYNCVAINTVIEEDYLLFGASKKKDKKKDNKSNDKDAKEIPPPHELDFTAAEFSQLVTHGRGFRLLHRLTVILSDPTNTQKLVQSPNVKKYDLLAVLPTTFPAFQHAVANLDIDIITYDPETSTDFRFNRRQYRQATERGIYYELPYAQLLKDATARRRIIQAAHTYHSVGKSRNIIISSGATTPLDLRGPYDIANLGLLLGLTEGEARSALTLGCRSVILHAAARRTNKCVSSSIESAKLSASDQWKVCSISLQPQPAPVEQPCINDDDEPPIAKKSKLC